MLKKLRIKFIALNMAMVALVLAVVFTSICLIDYQQSVSRVRGTLDAAVSHVPENDLKREAPTEDPATNASTPLREEEHTANSLSQSPLPPEIGQRDDGNPIIPVAVFSIDSDGTLTAIPTRTTASLSDDTLSLAAEALANTSNGSGTLENLGLFYQKKQIDGVTYLAFADQSAVDGWQNLALTLVGVGALALMVFFVISVFFSQWALRPVAQAWDQQRRFVADASHDLKTPFTVILANTSILMEHPERSIASQSQWIESTQNEAERMQGLIGDLLLLASIDEGSAQPVFENVDISDLVEGEILQFESVAFERGIGLDGNVEAGLIVHGDKTRLRRLVATLLDNACKYADENGSIDVALSSTARWMHLAVHNTGPAIAPEELPHVFDRFYRADKARSRDDDSYGLGLAIAHAIALEHDGTLTVTSDEHGTTFTCTLPIVRR